MRTRLLVLTPLLLLACSGDRASDDSAPPRDAAAVGESSDVPEGMRRLPSGGSGHVFMTTLTGSASARQFMQGLLQGVQPYFGGSAQMLQAIANPDDTRLQVAFRAERDGKPVMGMLAIEVHGDAAPAVMVFDDASAFAGSIDRLMSVAMSEGTARAGGSAPAEEALNRTPIPDGSGNIDLARGWVIRFAQKGAMDIQGPVPGSGMSLGAVAPVPYTSLDPVEALRTTVAQIGQQQGKQLALNVLDARPMDWVQGGRAALIRYRIVTDGQSMDYFALIGVTPYESNQVFLYTSYIQATTATFAQIFPTALRSWGSWSINPAVFAERLQAAATSMRETGEILTRGSGSASRAFDGVNAGWGEYIRGVATLESGDRTRSEVDQRFADHMVRTDPNNFRIVPTSELVR